MKKILFILSWCLCLALVCNPAEARKKRVSKPKITSSWSFVENRLKENKFDADFISEMQKVYETRHFQSVLELNILLFLRQSDDHGPQVQRQAVEETIQFLNQNAKAFEKSEKKYHVPASVVASLLWIESRHGRNQGNFHVPSVYLSLLQADRKPVQAYLKKRASYFRKNPPAEKLAQIPERSQKKIDWALEELHAIEKAYGWKWTSVGELRGSFSGAFGMPQFIPSSYAKWARSASSSKVAPDLFRADDSIESVAYYLSDSGWKSQDAETHVPALLKYNNSRDYARAILGLSDGVRSIAAQMETKKVADADKKD